MNGQNGWNADEQEKSRSLKKRESTALQQQGAELAELSPVLLRSLPLPSELAAALAQWRGLKTREAKRRHMQYIGRLMREMEEEERQTLLLALHEIQSEARNDGRELHRCETLRAALLDPVQSNREQAFRKALSDYPLLSEARLRHLVEAALADMEKKRPPRYARELFRYLRDMIGKTTSPQ